MDRFGVAISGLFEDRCWLCFHLGHYFCSSCKDKFLHSYNEYKVLPEVDVLIAFAYNKAVEFLIESGKNTGYFMILRFLAENVSKEILSNSKFKRTLLFNPIFTFVPITKKKRQARGFNQAENLAKWIGFYLGQSLFYKFDVVDIFERLDAKSTQVGSNREARMRKISGNFVLINSPPRNRPIFIIDDVVTTGATLSECAAVLRSQGYRDIYGLVIASH